MIRSVIRSGFLNDDSGAVSVSASWLIGIFIVLTGGAAEMGNSYWQSNAIQHAAKMGARIATTSEPVSVELATMTGLSSNVDVGDPVPAYKIVCHGKTQSCNRGGFNQLAFNKIFYGRNNDGTCEATTQETRGMCDMFENLIPENVVITYESSGMGRAGNPPILIPVVTVTIADLEQNYLFLDFLGERTIGTQVSALAEDLK